LLDHALSDLRLPAVWALVGTGNMPGIAFARSLGFLCVGERQVDGEAAQVFVKLPASTVARAGYSSRGGEPAATCPRAAPNPGRRERPGGTLNSFRVGVQAKVLR
jgi:hypothetical protein